MTARRLLPIQAPLSVLAAFAILSATLTPMPASAQPGAVDESIEIARCIRMAARGHAWLEKTLWGLRMQEAGWLGAEVANTNGSHDLGPLQINSSWVPRVARLIDRPERQVRHWLQYDACFNAEVARWIFLSGLKMTGNYWKAVGVYHSPTAWRQRAYATRVANHMRIRFGPDIFVGGSAVGFRQDRCVNVTAC